MVHVYTSIWTRRGIFPFSFEDVREVYMYSSIGKSISGDCRVPNGGIRNCEILHVHASHRLLGQSTKYSEAFVALCNDDARITIQ